MVLISKVEYEELKKNELVGVYWNMKELESRINKSAAWIKENILYPQRFKKILDVKNGGFVYYPESQGQHWAFQATKMAKFLEENFGRIFGSNV
jgi:phage pi2 protein 07